MANVYKSIFSGSQIDSKLQNNTVPEYTGAQAGYVPRVNSTGTALELAEVSGTGTVSSVSVKMNGEVKGTVTASGTIDLGSEVLGLRKTVFEKQWNQVATDNSNFSAYNSSYGSASVADGVITYTATQSGLGYIASIKKTITPATSGHIYYLSFEAKSSIARTFGYDEFGDYFSKSVTANTFTRVDTIYTATSASTQLLFCPRETATFAGETYQIRRVMVIDLTAIFGSGNEPTTVDEFKAMYPADYYPYSGSGCSTWATLLWTNASPTSDFPYQTVSLTLTDYNAVLIIYSASTTSIGQSSCLALIDGTQNVTLAVTLGKIVYRISTVSATGVAFTASSQVATYGSTATSSNTFLIPLKIYGLK